MATEDPHADPSRQTNPNKCETDGTDGDTTEPDSGDRELPTPEDVLWSVIEECHDLVDLPVADREGTSVREDYAEETWESWDSDSLRYCGRCESTFAPRVQSETEHVVDAHGDYLADSDLSPADAADAWIRTK